MRKATFGALGGALFALVPALLAGACAEGAVDEGPSEGVASTGVCANTCPKACRGDDQCDTSSGQLCCDLGASGSVCMAATECPRFCDSDGECDTAGGEVCGRASAASNERTCVAAPLAAHSCDGDAGCQSGEECCDILAYPACVPAGECPKSCNASSECTTSSGEVCCTTISLRYPALDVSGICVNPQLVPCPTPCSTSDECKTQAGEVCCDGICSTHCQKSCSDSNECPGQICCTAATVVDASSDQAYPVPEYDCHPYLLGNGVCDEPVVCAPNSDIVDCACPYKNDGYCEEPDLCPPGSDWADCGYGY